MCCSRGICPWTRKSSACHSPHLPHSTNNVKSRHNSPHTQSQTNIKIGNALLWFLLPESNKLQFLEKDWSQRELPQANPQQQQVQQSQNPLQKNLSTELEEAAVKGDEME